MHNFSVSWNHLQVNYFITAFYDSAIYLAMAYRKTLQEGGDINDGMAVAQKLWNSSFSGRSSHFSASDPFVM